MLTFQSTQPTSTYQTNLSPVLTGYTTIRSSFRLNTTDQEIGEMGLTRTSPTARKVYGRTLPHNEIFVGSMSPSETIEEWNLDDTKIVISSDSFPFTDAGYKAVGYEDPTYIQPEANCIVPGKAGLFCSQTYRKNDSEGLYCNLVYCTELDSDNHIWDMRSFITPEHLESLGFADTITMVKEAEPFQVGNDHYLIFEYADLSCSHLGWAKVENGALAWCLPFYSATQDQSEHISTAGAPIQLEDGTIILFFNRRRDNEWHITWMATPRFSEHTTWTVHNDAVVRADEDDRFFGPDRQTIAFASCCTQIDPNTVEILYHINDIKSARALLNLGRSTEINNLPSLPVLTPASV